jgi:hypothetical protein
MKIKPTVQSEEVRSDLADDVGWRRGGDGEDLESGEKDRVANLSLLKS